MSVDSFLGELGIQW